MNQAVAQAAEQSVMLDLAFRSFKQCWSTCFDSTMTAAALRSGTCDSAGVGALALEAHGESNSVLRTQCQTRCVKRVFEVMNLLQEGREMREREAMQGLAPGTLATQKHEEMLKK